MADYYVWIYILESPDKRMWTVGAARDLVDCFEQYQPEHKENFPNRLVAVYRFSMPREENDGMGARHPKCIEYELSIAAKMMKRVGSEWYNVMSRLGVFSKSDYYPKELTDQKDFPVLCFCGYPAEKRMTKKAPPGKQCYYSCPRRNRKWILDTAIPSYIRIEATKGCGFFAHSSFYD